jgi:hypothetical protein
VAIFIHGGCSRDLPGAGREQLRPIASEVAKRAHSKAVTLLDIPGAGHFDLVTPGTAAWREVEARIVELLRVTVR